MTAVEAGTAVGGPKVVRTLPGLDADNHAFWTGGELGQLRIHRCGNCRRFFHPPAPACHWCGSGNVAPEATSGRGVVGAFTVVHHRWSGRRGAEGDNPGWPTPYVFALIELAEERAVRVSSNVIGCDPEEVFIGMDVSVTFEQQEDVWIPLFRPTGAAST
jgi:hypothetical protein